MQDSSQILPWGVFLEEWCVPQLVDTTWQSWVDPSPTLGQCYHQEWTAAAASWRQFEQCNCQDASQKQTVLHSVYFFSHVKEYNPYQFIFGLLIVVWRGLVVIKWWIHEYTTRTWSVFQFKVESQKLTIVFLWACGNAFVLMKERKRVHTILPSRIISHSCSSQGKSAPTGVLCRIDNQDECLSIVMWYV